MKIYFMKQSALDYIKANIGTLYINYFKYDSPEWIYDLFDYDPFEVFDNVDDFELADLNQKPGEIDLQNCKILYSRLQHISDSQASDERLWAGLCNKNFYTYLRTRWQYARRHLKKTTDDSSAIVARYFYKSTGRSGMFRNTLARCWWAGRLTYSEKYSDHWELLDAIGSEDLISKISDIFYSNTYSSNAAITEGFCEGLKFYRDRGIYVSNRDHIRPTAQYLNAIGGGVLLDTFTAEEIKKIVVERLGLLIKGADIGLETDLEYSSEEVLDMEEETGDAEEVNIDFGEYLDLLEPVTDIDIDNVLGALNEVEYGCIIHIHKMPEDTYFISNMPMVNGTLNMMQKWFLGKGVGASWQHARSTYEIVDIRRS